ncbi:MAG TPA: dienelactone hydrolase family protein [Allosphingosinicella sp.]|jgi:carboxymethylenebutenolidase
MTDSIRAAAIALYDRYTHEGMDRRAFMAELTRIAGSTAAASALLAGIAADPAAAAVVAADDKRVIGRRMRWPLGGGRFMHGYQAEPAAAKSPLGAVMVIHENRGLNAYAEDVARRVALAGYRAVAPDFLSLSGGTPADQDAARAAIGKLDLAQSAADAVATLGILKTLPNANGRAGVIGFCWGGGMVNRIAVAAGSALHAGIAYYGPAPDPALAPRVEAAMLLHYAERDERVNATGLPWAEALKAAGKTVQSFVYPGVEHAFHNDTSAERFNEAAATLSWQRTLDFLKAHVGIIG